MEYEGPNNRLYEFTGNIKISEYVFALLQSMLFEPLYNGASDEMLTSLMIRCQVNSLCTKQPLNKGHLSILSKCWSPKVAIIERFHCTVNQALV